MGALPSGCGAAAVLAVAAGLERARPEGQGSRVRERIGATGSPLSQFLDEAGDGAQRTPSPDPLADADTARFRLSESVERFLREEARDKRLLVVLDDLHWADQPSLSMLEFIARDLGTAPLVVLAGCREEGTGIAGLLGRLTRERSFQRLDLSALDRLAVAKLVALSNDASPRTDWVDLLWQRTQGNPLYVVEVLRALPRGADPAGARLADLPGVRAVIRQRLASLSLQCQELLEAAAALGAEFTAEVLAAAAGAAVLSLLDEAAAARLVTESADRPGVYRFSHPLVQDALSTQPSASGRAELHSRIARALETCYGEGRDRHAAELAHHFELAGSDVPSGKLAHYSRIAGEQALANFAMEEAMRHFRTGLVIRSVGAQRSGDGLAPVRSRADAGTAALSLFGRCGGQC